MRPITIHLEERQAAALDAVARRRGVTRAEVVRHMIDDGLAAVLGDLQDDVEAIEASFGVLAGDVSAPLERVSSSRDDHLTRLWRR